MLFLLAKIARHFPAGVTPRFFDHLRLADEVGAFEGAFFVGRFEDEAVAAAQSSISFIPPLGGEKARVFTLKLAGLQWTRADFCRGWLITGDTGSGKTSLTALLQIVALAVVAGFYLGRLTL